MTKPTVKIYDCETGQETVRDATAEEIAQIKADVENDKIQKAKLDAQAAADAAARSAAESKLAALGLNINDLRALGL
jgi:hypothetical protein